MTNHSFFIAGEPKAKQGDRSFMAKGKFGKPYIQHYTDPKIGAVAKNMAAQLLEEFEQLPNHRIIDYPIEVHVDFIFKPVKGKIGTIKATKPDIDNLLKMLFDVMKKTIISDDNIIVQVTAKKRYAKKDEEPGTWLHITAISEHPLRYPEIDRKRGKVKPNDEKCQNVRTKTNTP